MRRPSELRLERLFVPKWRAQKLMGHRDLVPHPGVASPGRLPYLPEVRQRGARAGYVLPVDAVFLDLRTVFRSKA